MSESIRRAETEDCADFIDRAAREKERVRVVREGEEVAAVIPIEDLNFLERIEDHLDYLEAREALEKGERGKWAHTLGRDLSQTTAVS